MLLNGIYYKTILRKDNCAYKVIAQRKLSLNFWTNYLKALITSIIFILIIAGFFSCNSNRPVVYSKEYSPGFYNEGNIYFLLDYDVWQRGRSFWFIMPFEGRKKVYFREIYLYRYEPELGRLDKLSVLRKDFKPATNLRYTRFTEDNGNIVFAYAAGYDKEINRLVDIFIWNTELNKIIDTDFDNPVTESNLLFKKYFSDYKSPYSDNPGIIEISRLKNEILQHLSDEDYKLPEKW